jgi:hypothetical protein
MQIVIKAMAQKPGPDRVSRSRWAIIRGTYPELISTTIKTWSDWVKPEYFGPIRYATPITHRVMLSSEVELEVIFLALERDQDVKKLLSLELTGAWINEAKEVPESVLQMLTGRVGRYPAMRDGGASWSGVILDTNSPDDDHWWYRLAEEEKPEGYEFFTQPGGLTGFGENIPNLPGGIEYYRRQLAGKPEDWIKVFIHGLYGSTEDGKPVYPEWHGSFHVQDDLAVYRGLPLIIGVDFGLCYDSQTEVLTESGWKFFKDVDEKTDRVATRNPDTGEMIFVLPNFKVDKEWDGELIGFKSQNVDFLVTPEHRIPLYKRTGHNGDKPGKDTPMFFESAEWAYENASKHLYVAAKSNWAGEWPGEMFDMSPEVFAAFMGIYLSEGSTGENGRINIAQRPGEKAVQIASLLEETNIEWHYDGKAFRCTDHLLSKYLSEFGLCKEKRVPFVLRNNTPEIIRHFIDWFTIGDGHIRQRENGSIEHTIFTTSKTMADDFIELAQKIGWSASWRWRKSQTSYLDGRRIDNSGGYAITFKKRHSHCELIPKRWYKKYYKGRVYCLNVPFHTLYVKREGVAHWNGNTPAAAIGQVTPRGQMRVLAEVVTEDMGIRRFIEDALKPVLATEFQGMRFTIIGDPAGAQRAQTDERTCFDEFVKARMPAYPAPTNVFATRREAVANYLTKHIESGPGFLIDSKCTMLIKGFNGRYKYRRMQLAGTAKYTEKPDKNIYSHVHDSLQYGCLGSTVASIETIGELPPTRNKLL